MLKYVLKDHCLYILCEGNIFYTHSFQSERPVYKEAGGKVFFCESRTSLRIALKYMPREDGKQYTFDFFYSLDKEKIKASIFDFLYKFACEKLMNSAFSKDFLIINDLDAFVDKLEASIKADKDFNNKRKYRIHTENEARSMVADEIASGKNEMLKGKSVDDVEIILYDCLSEEIKNGIFASREYDHLIEMLEKSLKE